MRRRLGGLWRNADFLKLWSGETISSFGDQITLLALPLTAVLTLNASAVEMGLLAAAGRAPILLFSLPAGVWVDRLRRRPILVAADMGSALALATVPVAFVLGMLTMTQLYVVAFVTGTLSVFFIIAYQSYLPSLVGREHLVEANGKMSSTDSVAQLGGPAVAGLLVQLFTAPMPVVVDALSFVASALGVTAIRAREPAPAQRPRRRMLAEIGEGMSTLWQHPSLRTLLTCASLVALFFQGQMAIYVLFMTRDVDLSPSQIGLVFAVGSVGAVAGAMGASSVAKRLGLGASFFWGAVLAVAGLVIRAVAAGGPLTAMIALATGQFIFTLGFMWWNVNGPALRQALVPSAVLGRVNATWRFAVWGTGPIGALIGGILGETLGLRPAMILLGLATLVPLALIATSALARQREIAPLVEPAAAG